MANLLSPPEIRGHIALRTGFIPTIHNQLAKTAEARKQDMLFIFNRPNGLHIAWHGQGPTANIRRNLGGNGFMRLIRTRSAG